jgi:hypothetical protein
MSAMAFATISVISTSRFCLRKTLKSNTARALRRWGRFSNEQKDRIRRRVFGMLRDGHIPHEYREYARLARKVGFDASEIPPVDEGNKYTVRFRNYFREAARVDKKTPEK